MEVSIGMRKQLANLTSNILNPFWVSLAIIVLLSFVSTTSTADALKWALISALVSILPVFLVVMYLVQSGRLDAVFTNIRGQRTKIYILAGVCAVTGIITLAYLQAPSMLVAAFTAGLSMTIMFMAINLWWKISIHTALVAASATVLVMLYGWTAAASVGLVPLTAWARIELNYHSLAQTAVGALLAVLIVMVVFYPLVLA